MCCAWPPTPTTICWCSTRPSSVSCTGAATAGWPPRRSGWCCTPSSAGVRARVVTCPPTGVRCTTPTRTGPAAGRPTSTSSPWRADPITGWPPTGAGPPEKTIKVKRNGSRHHIWIEGSGEGTTSIILNECWMTTRSATDELADCVGECVVVVPGGGVAGIGEFDELGGGHLVEEVFDAVAADHIGKLPADQQDGDP